MAMVNVPIVIDWLKICVQRTRKKSEDQIPTYFLPKNTYLRTDFIAISGAHCISLLLPAMILRGSMQTLGLAALSKDGEATRFRRNVYSKVKVL